MNKEKITKILSKKNISPSKSFINNSIIMALLSNILLYYVFKNVYAIIISGIIFCFFAVTLLRNKRYVDELEPCLIVRVWMAAQLSWLLVLLVILLQIKIKTSFWIYCFELILTVGIIFIAKKCVSKFFEDESDSSVDRESLNKKSIAINASIYFFFSVFHFAFSQHTVLSILSLLIFALFLFAFLFFVAFFIQYILYIRYCY